MLYLFDTNAISALMRGDQAIVSWLSALPPDSRLAACTISRGEILFGIERLAPGRRRIELEASANRAFRLLPCEVVPAEAARIYAIVKASQQRQGLSLDENDLWIAATTLSLRATLVTSDCDFLSLSDLKTATITPR